MRFFPCFLLPLAMVAMSLPLASADDNKDATYDLRNLAPKKSSKFTSKSTFTMEDVSVTVKFNGKFAGKYKETSVQKRESQLDILELDGTQVTKVRYKLFTDSTVQTQTARGRTKTETKKGVLAGLPIIGVRDAKTGWKSTLEKGTPTPQQQEKLDDKKFTGLDKDAYPEKKVKVGDGWTIEAKTLAKMFGTEVAGAKGQGKATLKKVEKIGGESCAVIEMDIDFTGKHKFKDSTGTIEMKGKLIEWKSLVTGITMKEQFKGTMGSTQSGKQGSDTIEITSQGKVIAEDTTTKGAKSDF